MTNPAEQPSEAHIEAGAEASFRDSDFEGQYAELSEMSKALHREKAVAIYLAMQRAATPAPVQDDDAELAATLPQKLRFSVSNPFYAHGIDEDNLMLAAADFIERIAARLSTDTALVEALKEAREFIWNARHVENE